MSNKAEVAVVAIDIIKEDKRFREDYGDIEGLAESIRSSGLIQPLAVHKVGEDLTLLAGGRRLRASKIAGLTEVPVRIYSDDLNEYDRRLIELTENIYRKNMTWQEEITLKKAVHELSQQIHGAKTNSPTNTEGWSAEDSAKMFGESRRTFMADVNLAEKLQMVPGLSELANKNDARKLLDKMSKLAGGVVRSAEVVDLVARSGDVVRKKLIESYIVADFFEGISKLPDSSFDFIEIDPPYAIDFTQSYADRGDAHKINTQEYHEIAREKYIPFMIRVFKECARLLKPNCFIICWHACEWSITILQIMEGEGLSVCGIPALWTKRSGATLAFRYNLANGYEPFLYGRKGNAELSKQGRLNVFNFPNLTAGKAHPTERPIEMIQEVIETFCNLDTTKRVLVPFLGSGNTLLALANLGIEGVGFEKSGEYKHAFIEKVQASAPGSYKSYKGGEENASPQGIM